MDQFIPVVSEIDIERIVKRDFSSEDFEEIFKMINSVQVIEKTRVILACLKNSNGNIKKLRNEIENASGYWREIISQAEYPNYNKNSSKIYKLPQEQQEIIINKDRDQYLNWLGRLGITI